MSHGILDRTATASAGSQTGEISRPFEGASLGAKNYECARPAAMVQSWGMSDSDSSAVVLRGEASDGLTWTITAAGDDRDFSTMLNIYREDKLLSGSGMGGPKLYGSDVMNCAYGHSDDLPFCEMVRVDASVDQVVATTSAGTEIVLALSGVNTEFSLRFGAALLPEGEEPGEVRAEIGNRTVQTESHRRDWKRRFGGPDGAFGWRPTSS